MLGSINDDTRIFASISISALHDVWHLIACNWLAGVTMKGLVDEEDVHKLACAFAYDLAKRAYNLDEVPASPTTEGRVGRLRYRAAPSRDEMRRLAANQAAEILQTAVAQRGSARAVFAAAPSQDELLLALREAEVPWEAVTTFHLDEYLGLHENAPQLFRRYLEEHLFGHLPFHEVHLILKAGERLEPEEASSRYQQLLGDAPLDLARIGIGENGHIAFNDPQVADFNDPRRVRVVELDEACRRQQVHDSAFARLEEVPLQAVTLTVPTIMAARAIVCVVPGERKREALRRALYGPVTSDCPASVLRTHPNIMLYLDPESTAALREPG